MNSKAFRLLRNLAFAASLLLVIISIALSLRSNRVEDELAYTSPDRRWAIASQAGALQISSLHQFSGTVQRYFIKFTSGTEVDEFDGKEVPFGAAGWSSSQKLTMPLGSDAFLVPGFHSWPGPPIPWFLHGHMAGSPNLDTFSGPEPTSFVTGTSVWIPYWLLMLIGLTPLLRAIRRMLKAHPRVPAPAT